MIYSNSKEARGINHSGGEKTRLRNLLYGSRIRGKLIVCYISGFK